MSIETELQTLTTDVSNAYDAVEAKGGTLPAQKNTNNLATAINSISGGGGGELYTDVYEVACGKVVRNDFQGKTLQSSYREAAFSADLVPHIKHLYVRVGLLDNGRTCNIRVRAYNSGNDSVKSFQIVNNTYSPDYAVYGALVDVVTGKFVLGSSFRKVNCARFFQGLTSDMEEVTLSPNTKYLRASVSCATTEWGTLTNGMYMTAITTNSWQNTFTSPQRAKCIAFYNEGYPFTGAPNNDDAFFSYDSNNDVWYIYAKKGDYVTPQMLSTAGFIHEYSRETIRYEDRFDLIEGRDADIIKPANWDLSTTDGEIHIESMSEHMDDEWANIWGAAVVQTDELPGW